MDELGGGSQVQEFHGLREQQQRWRCKWSRVGHGDNGAEGAIIVRVLVGIPVGGGLRSRLTNYYRRVKPLASTIGLRCGTD